MCISVFADEVNIFCTSWAVWIASPSLSNSVYVFIMAFFCYLFKLIQLLNSFSFFFSFFCKKKIFYFVYVWVSIYVVLGLKAVQWLIIIRLLSAKLELLLKFCMPRSSACHAHDSSTEVAYRGGGVIDSRLKLKQSQRDAEKFRLVSAALENHKGRLTKSHSSLNIWLRSHTSIAPPDGLSRSVDILKHKKISNRSSLICLFVWVFPATEVQHLCPWCCEGGSVSVSLWASANILSVHSCFHKSPTMRTRGQQAD